MKVGLGLLLASAGSGAVASFNTVDYDLTRAILDAAEEVDSPVIVGVAARQWDEIDAPRLVPAILRLIDETGVSVALHLDHAKLAHRPIIDAALDLGFSSIMFDGSMLDFDRNRTETRKVVEIARRYNTDVEGELGSVAGEEGVADQKHLPADSVYTDPAAAERFVADSGVGALAVAVGTAHGLYAREPRIRFDIIREIHRRVAVPLVLHGATGLADSQIRQAVKAGIRKINFFSGFLVAAMEQVRAQAQKRENDFLGYKHALVDRWKSVAKQQITLYSEAQSGRSY